MFSFIKYAKENKYILFVSLFTFLLIYLSSFVKSYGYFIDEFYYIACANNPAFGYVDHPPLAPLVLTIFQFVFGDSIYAIRIIPALATSLAVLCTGVLTKEVGGNKFAQFLAALSVASMPVTLAFGGFYSMNAFEPLLAVLLLLIFVRIIKTGNLKLWMFAGLIMGIGIMNKHTFGIFIVALFFSLIVSGKWKIFFNRWVVVGSLISLIIILPNILWQIANDFPSLEFYRNISKDKNVYTPPVAFILGQVMQMSPSTVPIWLAGTFVFLFSKKVKDFRFLSILFLSLFLFMMISGTSRSDRLAFAYPAVFAGGAIFFENILSSKNLIWLRYVLVVLLITGIGLAIPVILPYFDYSTVKSHTEFLGLNTEIEKGKKPPIPQLLADRIGWEDKVKLVVSAYNSLTEKEKKQSIIAAGNYGQAGAIELYGKPYNLPPVACAHNNYYLWSKNRIQGNIVLQLDNDVSYQGFSRLFEKVDVYPGTFKNNYVSSHENNLVVFICREPKMPPIEMLERSKNFN